jgi:amino acid adenylation domain-containing protein
VTRGATTLGGLLVDAACRAPDAPAVDTGETVVTYRELERWSARVAAALVAVGVSPGCRVVLDLPKSPAAVAAIYGVMRTGAAYVPVDTRSPFRRRACIALDADPAAVITSAQGRTQWLAQRVAPVLSSDDVDGAPELEPVATAGADLAYILYTSGSTGAPKGVCLTHDNALHFVRWAVEEMEITTEDRLASVAPFHFDLSVLDLFGAAAARACVCLAPEELAMWPRRISAFVEQQGITVWYSVPSVLIGMLAYGRPRPDVLRSLRVVLFAGEVFPPRELRRLMELAPQARFLNLYGPTETNVCTWYEVHEPPPADGPAVPIGKPLPDTRLTIVDEAGSPRDDCGPGELWVEGPTVMQGYWRDKGRTGDALVRMSDSHGQRSRAYRTGDIVRRLPTGELVFVGRRDHQVKVRGHRVELGEVESVLAAHPSVVECAVCPEADGLAAFVVLAEGSPTDSVVELTTHSLHHLPRYMVPDRITVLSALPKTSTGKVDRRALPTRTPG